MIGDVLGSGSAQMDGIWTNEHRARHAAFECRRSYRTDLIDDEWAASQSLLPLPSGRGKPPGADMREMLTSIRYLARAGCDWRMMPVHFGPWQTVN